MKAPNPWQCKTFYFVSVSDLSSQGRVLFLNDITMHWEQLESRASTCKLTDEPLKGVFF